MDRETRETRESTGFLLVRICRLRRQLAQGHLEQVGIHRGQHWVLHALWQQEGMTQTELADRVEVRPATVTRGLRRMETAGLIERRPDPRDQRVSRVYLTEAGRALRSDLEATWRDFDRLTFAGFDDRDLETLGDYLKRIILNLEAHDKMTSDSDPES